MLSVLATHPLISRNADQCYHAIIKQNLCVLQQLQQECKPPSSNMLSEDVQRKQSKALEVFGLRFWSRKKSLFMREVFFDINNFISLESASHLHNHFSAVEDCYCSMKDLKSVYWVLIRGELPCNTEAAIFIMLWWQLFFHKGCQRVTARLKFPQLMQKPWLRQRASRANSTETLTTLSAWNWSQLLLLHSLQSCCWAWPWVHNDNTSFEPSQLIQIQTFDLDTMWTYYISSSTWTEAHYSQFINFMLPR